MTDAQAPSPPSLADQMAWSRVLHERLEGKCWHVWQPRSAFAVNCMRPWYCTKCGLVEDVAIGDDLYGQTPQERHPDFETPPRSDINYCTWAKAMPALQKALRGLDTHVEHMILIGRIAELAQELYRTKRSNIAPQQLACQAVLGYARPWHIVHAIADSFTMSVEESTKSLPDCPARPTIAATLEAEGGDV